MFERARSAGAAGASRNRPIAAMTVAALIAALFVAAPMRRATAAPLPSDGYVGTDGRGFGHGRGLGQWGAKGLADQGKTWNEILAHYYGTATLGSRAAEPIRVLVEDSTDVLVTSRQHPFSVYWKGGAKVADSSADNPFLRAAVSGSGLTIQRAPSSAGPWTTVATANATAEFRAGPDVLGLVASSGSVRYYRGVIEALRPQGSSTVLSINDLPMEAYLYGVVPREVPASWNGNALRAQATAARSYAANKKDAARAASKLYDICATTACQVYGGYASAGNTAETPKVLEHSATNAAVDATAGKVMIYGGKPILAEYSSSTGGYTSPSSQPWQQAKPDPADSVSPYHTWSTRISVSAIQSAYPAVGQLVNVRVTKRNGYGEWGGRVTEMVLEGTGGNVTLSGGAFRSKFNLRSDWFRVRTYRAELYGLSAEVSGPTGTAIPVSVSLKNIGTAEWKLGGSQVLATWSPSGRESIFAGSEWRSPSKPGAITRNLSRSAATTVGPGEVAEFRFNLHAEQVAPGVYVESFRPLEDGLTWMPDIGITITVRVQSSWFEVQGNMIANPGFESGWSSWSSYGGYRSGDGPATGTTRDGVRSMHLGAGGRKGIVQRLSLAGGPGRRMSLTGFARTVGTSASGGPILITVALRNVDGSTTWNPVEFSRSSHDWQYVERTVVANKRFAGADVYATFYNQTGHVYFDALRLVDNAVANASFDMGSAGWSSNGTGSGDGPSTTVFRDGFRSWHFSGGTKSLVQRVGLGGPAGRMYQTSGWTKADGGNEAGATSIVVQFNNWDGSTSRTTIAAPPGSHEWTYHEQHVVAEKSFRTLDVIIAVSVQTGSIFFDGLRFNENRIPNGSFESGLSPWFGAGAGASDGVTEALARDGAKAFRLVAGDGRRGAKITMQSGGSAGTRLMIGGWNRSMAPGTSNTHWISVGFRNTDGTTTWRNLYFPAASHDWVHQEMVAVADKAYSTLDVYVMSSSPAAESVFDGVTLWAHA